MVAGKCADAAGLPVDLDGRVRAAAWLLPVLCLASGWLLFVLWQASARQSKLPLEAGATHIWKLRILWLPTPAKSGLGDCLWHGFVI